MKMAQSSSSSIPTFFIFFLLASIFAVGNAAPRKPHGSKVEGMGIPVANSVAFNIISNRYSMFGLSFPITAAPDASGLLL